MENQEKLNIVDNKMISERILKLRKEIGFTQAEMAKLIGVSRPFYTFIENNQRKVSVEMLARICKALDTDMDYIVFGYSSGYNSNSELLCELKQLIRRY